MKKFLSIILFLSLLPNIEAYSTPNFEDDSTVCFVGNSITQDGRYHMLLHAYYATKHPEKRVKFIGCGIGGDTAEDMIARFDSDIMRYKPDYAFLMTGMNDMTASLYVEGLTINDSLLSKREATMQRYEQLTERLINMMLERGIQPILMTPSIYDETAKIETKSHVGKCAALLECAEHIKAMGERYNLAVVDLTQFMLDINLEAQKQRADYTIVSNDRVHPKETGHFIMAYQIINTLWGDEKIVDTYTIDAKKEDKISFTHRAKALPFPITESYKEAQQFVPFIESHNQELLTVKGLKSGEYLLKISNIAVDTLSNKVLQRGVNLATNHLTPQYKEAEQIFALCERYHELQTILRFIANVEFKRLKAYKGADTMEAKRKYLDDANEKNRGKSWYANGVKIVNTYYEYKPREEQILEELDQLRSQISKLNRSKEYNYELHRIR